MFLGKPLPLAFRLDRLAGSREQVAFSGSICRNGSPNSAFNVRHALMAASAKVTERPRLPLGSASQTGAGSNQMCRDPRCFNATP
jgi:hypothetical protein